MPYFETTDSTRLFYKDFGSGPPAVLVHAWFEVYPGAPHRLYVTERERLAKDLLGLLARTTR